MNILFLTTGRMDSFKTHSIYPDLLREFMRNGHTVYAVSTLERRFGQPTCCDTENGSFLLRVRIGNLTKCGLAEKGISTLRIKSQFKKAIDRYFPDVRFDLIVYSTPPITLSGVIQYYKKRDNARTYLMLKDIFPQNAVDIGILSKTGAKAPLYRYFRRQEKKMYAISDTIGCMSPANAEYVKRHDPEIPPERISLCPNCIDLEDVSLSEEEKRSIRGKYGLPEDKTVFLYGGNLGKPQGIPFMLECFSRCENSDAFFFVVGDGTEFDRIKAYIDENKPKNLRLERRLPKEDFDRMTSACDVGMIFLDHRFTIPNFPSRLLTYLQARVPVIAFTDPNTDIGKVILEGDFGWWGTSDDADSAARLIERVCKDPELLSLGENGYRYLCKNYTVSVAYDAIMSRCQPAQAERK